MKCRIEFARGMYLLKKIIQFRENSQGDHEKPFLEHLEDLRIMITRIVITLVVSVTVCFLFQQQLMEILRRPVERMWVEQVQEALPTKQQGATKELDVDTWEQAKRIEHAASALPSEAKDVFYLSCDKELAFHARSVSLLRALLALPETSRTDFLSQIKIEEPLKKQVLALLETAPSPEIDARGNLRLMSALRPTETFMLSMKLSFFAGIVLAFPLLLLFILQFILPGLHGHERKMLWPALAIGFGLFLCGVLFAYLVVLPRALDFFYQWSGNLGVSNDWRIGEYISFATQFSLLFGLSFELPVVVMVLVKLGLLSYETMSRSRSYAVLAIFVSAAILTPTPDAFTLTLMALPMLVLYEICIWLAWYDARKNRMRDEMEAREQEEDRLKNDTPPSNHSEFDRDPLDWKSPLESENQSENSSQSHHEESSDSHEAYPPTEENRRGE
ncbi:MAG: twin-arginine translocase subunit TatC [Luteolibacter sp.]